MRGKELISNDNIHTSFDSHVIKENNSTAGISYSAILIWARLLKLIDSYFVYTTLCMWSKLAIKMNLPFFFFYFKNFSLFMAR